MIIAPLMSLFFLSYPFMPFNSKNKETDLVNLHPKSTEMVFYSLIFYVHKVPVACCKKK